MRQNLTNIKEVNIEDVEHFYVVGSTTKEGLIEGRSNVKLDLKKVGGGEGGDTPSGGSFNIDDIILADDLLEKCQALGLEEDQSVDVDWKFSDICTQDSYGMLQAAFEDAVYAVDPEYPDEPYMKKGVFILCGNENAAAVPFFNNRQEIHIYTNPSNPLRQYFSITYNPTIEKYNVKYYGGVG